jgi:hypothetical protein
VPPLRIKPSNKRCSPCSTYSSTMKKETVRSSETSMNFYRTTKCHIPEDGALHVPKNMEINVNVPHLICDLSDAKLGSHGYRIGWKYVSV